MTQNNKLTIVIPIHEMIEREYISNLFESISRQTNKNFEVLIATYKELTNSIKDCNTFGLELKFYDLPSELKAISPNYSEIVNFVSNFVTSEYFSIIQFDDQLNDNYVESFVEYSTAYPEVNVFLQTVLDFEDGNFIRMNNEAFWTMQYTQKQGYLDFDSLKKLSIVSAVGAIYKTQLFLDYSGFKTSIKQYFEYEFLLRLTYKLNEVMIIPKFTIKHTVNRPNSLSLQYEQMEKLESMFYLDLSRKEYFFDEDRKIIYTPSNQ